MTLRNSQAGVEMARCRLCDHDLMVRIRSSSCDGKVYCSNRICKLHTQEHMMGNNLCFKGGPLNRSYRSDPDAEKT